MQQQRADALSAVQTSFVSKNFHSLRDAIARAESLCVDSAEIERARKGLRELAEARSQEQRSDALSFLKAAEESSDPQLLETAIATAERHRVGFEALQCARQRLMDLIQEARAAELREQALAGLQAALERHDCASIASAIENAERRGVEAVHLRKARNRLQFFEEAHQRQRREEASNLEAALSVLFN